MKKVFISGAYSASTEEGILRNVNEAIDMGNYLIGLGYNVFVPHLSHLQHQRQEQTYEKWMDICFDWILCCDYLLRLPNESPGGDREVAFAIKNNIPVFYNADELTIYDLI